MYTIFFNKRRSSCFDPLRQGQVKRMAEYGTIRINLDKLIEKSGLSKNKLSHRAEMQRSQINHYCNNEVTRLDIDVLARICTVLECVIGDLLEFIPPAGK